MLADFHGADLIVSCGAHFDLESIFSERTYATPAALLTRVKIGARLVDSEAIEKLYTVRSGGSIAWLWAILGVLVAIAAVVVIAGTAGDGSFTQNLIDTWNNIALAFQGLFK
ncbi:conserved membrane protein [Corynebacterium pseudotuberculosis]|nr:conserved membrane protein [Corynebacterium pseudotuberculosis]